LRAFFYLSTVGAQARQTNLLSQHTIGEGISQLATDLILEKWGGKRVVELEGPGHVLQFIKEHAGRSWVSPDVGESLESPASICDPKQADVA
jgi:hypothetical protein